MYLCVMKILKRISRWLFNKELTKIPEFEPQKAEMLKNLSGAFKVFKKPYFDVSMEDYNGAANYFTIKGCKLFKIPLCFTNKPWKINGLVYYRQLGEFHIKGLPHAEAVIWGKKVTINTSIPKTNTTNPLNYWQSVLEFQEGYGNKNLRQTIERMGRASMGIQFDDYNPHVLEICGDDRMMLPSFGNSMYFVLDRSYVNPEYYEDYDWAVKLIKENESPMMI